MSSFNRMCDVVALYLMMQVLLASIQAFVAIYKGFRYKQDVQSIITAMATTAAIEKSEKKVD